MSDFSIYMEKQEITLRWKAEVENAAARCELAQRDERAAMIISQPDPVESLGLDRERLRLVLRFLAHGDKARLEREHHELKVMEAN
ncbi:MAG: hypothetical protein HQ473_07625 [Cryomorphaceae bacterium]|nr:hypothetical protein [Cryomorphaceae bacterium]